MVYPAAGYYSKLLFLRSQLLSMIATNMASIVMHLLVAVLFWPLAVPFGALVGVLYRLYPISLVQVFVRLVYDTCSCVNYSPPPCRAWLHAQLIIIFDNLLQVWWFSITMGL